MKSILFLYGLLGVLSYAFSQEAELKIKPKPVSINRYYEIVNEPFIFEDYVPCQLTETKSRKTYTAELRFNGYSGDFELLIDGKIYELDSYYYLKISMPVGTLTDIIPEKYISDTLHFIRGIHPTDFDRFYISLYQSDRINIIKSIEIDLVERQLTDTGQGVQRKLFFPRFYYFYIKNGQAETMLLTKGSVQKAFGGDKRITAYIKENKLKVNNEKELMQVINYYESLD